MQARVLTGLMVLFLVLGLQTSSRAADLFIGDSAIYSAGGSNSLRPNVLFIVDNSSFMKQGALGKPYDSTFPYEGPYSPNAIYRRISATGGTITYDNPNNPFISHISGVSCSNANSILTQTHYYTGPLLSNGECRGQTGFYYTGNLLNYLTKQVAGDAWQPSHLYNLGEYVQVTTATGQVLYYEVIQAGNSTGSQPTWGASIITDGGITWKRTGSVMDMVKEAINLVVEKARDKAKFGVMVFGDNNSGGQLIASVEKMAETDTITSNGIDGDDNLAAFQAEVAGMTYVDANTTEPINQALWDARLYYANQYGSASLRMGTDGPNVASNTASPIECANNIQPNFVVVLTMGNTYQAGAKANTIGNQDAAYNVGDVDDAAKRLYSGDITVTPATPAIPQIATTIIKLINDEPGSASDLTQSALRRAGAYGRGGYYLAENSEALAEALLEVMNNIVRETDTSFVAPVVPTSPENRTYSGERVYLGFFRPLSKKPWSGNLKKFAVNSLNQIVDKDDVVATYESGSQKGSFKPGAKSFWNNVADAGEVEVGGVGEVLKARTASRNIYTYLGTTTDLTAAANAFSTGNSAIHFDTTLGLASSADRDKLINFIHGIDAWDDDGDLNATEKRLWILGDILHSKPMVVNYNHFDFNKTNEASCSINKTMVFVGANDGMIHAIRDCDGSEAWAFIPPSLLPDLKLLPPGLQNQFNTDGAHPYFVDGSPVVYVYDHDDDGNIGQGPETSAADADRVGLPDDGSSDKVILLFGLRRGGDAYYALDVTNPENPRYLWKIDRNTVTASGDTFSELGQSWSMPQLARIKVEVSTVDTTKIVAFIGGGYDKEEDSRYGGEDDFPAPPTADDGEGYVISDADTTTWGPTTNRPNARGRAVYAFEVATLNSTGVPTIPASPVKIWGFTPTNGVMLNNPNSWVGYLLKYAIPSDVTVVDTNYDGYADRLYVGDLNGRMFAFEVGFPGASSNVNTWKARNIFYDDRGRKIFYRPSISLERGGTVLVAFGTGDREHPLNTRAYDAFYMVKDTGQTGVNSDASGYQWTRYTALENVTADYLQYDTPPNSLQTVDAILARLAAKPGWYINLSRYQEPIGILGGFGEKVLAAPLIFNKVVYFTTFMPNWTPTTDPCTPGNLGVSRLYAVNYKTGEAVLNFANASTANNNDSESTSGNSRALSPTGAVLRKADREVTLGVGIPSGLVVLMPPSGDAELLIGCGGGLCSEDPAVGGVIIPIYWMQW